MLQSFTGTSKKMLGENCPTAEVITYIDTCLQALLSLHLVPRSFDINNTDRPAGCYWKSNGNGYFNRIIDPSLTIPNSFGDRGGVCTAARKNCERISQQLDNKHNVNIFNFLRICDYIFIQCSHLLESVYSLVGGCEMGSDGISCDDSNGISCGTEVCQSCSFNECQQHAIASNSFAFSYRGTGTKWCKLCTRTEVSTQGTAHAQDWGIYIKGIS